MAKMSKRAQGDVVRKGVIDQVMADMTNAGAFGEGLEKLSDVRMLGGNVIGFEVNNSNAGADDDLVRTVKLTVSVANEGFDFNWEADQFVVEQEVKAQNKADAKAKSDKKKVKDAKDRAAKKLAKEQKMAEQKADADRKTE